MTRLLHSGTRLRVVATPLAALILLALAPARAGLALDPKQGHTEVQRGEEDLDRQGNAVMASGTVESGAARLIDGDGQRNAPQNNPQLRGGVHDLSTESGYWLPFHLH